MGALKTILIILAVVALIFVVAVAALVFWGITMIGSLMPFNIFGGNSNNPSLSAIFHQQIDPYFPTFIHTAEVSCVAINGQWSDSQTKVGCFNIPSGGFDSTNCQTTPYQALANSCNGVEGTHWVCTANNAGCYYV